MRECVQSVLAQSLGDLTLEILENGSTDGTGEWVRTLRDARVRVWPAPRPLSIEENWRRAVALRKGEFLLFVGHDDRLDAGYLAIVDELIRRSPDAALFTTHFRLIDARGRVLRSCRPMPARETTAGFLESRLRLRTDLTGTGVVMRSDAHDAFGGIPAFEALAQADDALLLALMDGSWKATASEEAFSYRLNPGGMTLSLSWRAAMTATEQYVGFVEGLGRSRADVRDVWRKHAPPFLARRYRFFILLAMMEAACGSAGFSLREQKGVFAALDRLSPEAGRRLRRSWRLRLAAWAGASPARIPVFACWRWYWRRRR